MAKGFIILMFVCTAIAIPRIAHSESVVVKQTTTKIHLFAHDRPRSGNRFNQTVYQVAQSSITSTSPTLFGQVSVIDNLLTTGPEPDSEVLGRFQGIGAFADLNDLAFHMSITFVFTSGDYNGSTLVMHGRYPFTETIRKVPITGGTGAFELARGIATSSTYSSGADETVIEYSIVVTHNEEIMMPS